MKILTKETKKDIKVGIKVVRLVQVFAIGMVVSTFFKETRLEHEFAYIIGVMCTQMLIIHWRHMIRESNKAEAKSRQLEVR